MNTWVPCTVKRRLQRSLCVSMLYTDLVERTVYVPRSLVAGQREGALLLPRWWVIQHPRMPSDPA